MARVNVAGNATYSAGMARAAGDRTSVEQSCDRRLPVLRSWKCTAMDAAHDPPGRGHMANAKPKDRSAALDEATQVIERRIAELEPLVAEHRKLVAARDALAGDGSKPVRRRGRPPKVAA